MEIASLTQALELDEPFVSRVLAGEETAYVVGRRCDEDEGYELCTTHDAILLSCEEHGAHCCRGGDHGLVWICLSHGPELFQENSQKGR